MLVELQDISKTFHGVVALSQVSLQLQPGVIHAICGENGAGKSTLMNILSGNLIADSGSFRINGEPMRFDGPAQAQAAGIAMVHQEKSLVGNLSIAENIFAGRQPANRLGWIDFSKMHTLTRNLLQSLQLDGLDPTRLVGDLRPAEQQLVEIAKALSFQPALLLLDEPTASLGQTETEQLFALLRRSAAAGCTVVFISHRLTEIYAIAETITILKDGRLVGSWPAGEISSEELIRQMVGRAALEPFDSGNLPGEVLLETQQISGNGFENISITLTENHIVGLAGLMGAGRTEIARAIFGLSRIRKGGLLVKGKRIDKQDPSRAVFLGIGFIPEDRKQEGIFPRLSMAENIGIAASGRPGHCSWFSPSKLAGVADHWRQVLGIRTAGTAQEIAGLSGGNQQKAIIGRWLEAGIEILIADEPTQGVDIAARWEIYRLLRAFAASGKTVLLISSDLPELLLLSDMIHVINAGRLTASFNRKEATEEKIIAAAIPQ